MDLDPELMIGERLSVDDIYQAPISSGTYFIYDQPFPFSIGCIFNNPERGIDTAQPACTVNDQNTVAVTVPDPVCITHSRIS